MGKDAYFILTLPAMYAVGYLFGRMGLPKMLRFPFPAHMIGRSIFLSITIFLALRSSYLAVFLPNNFSWWNVVSSYVDIGMFAIGITFGYSSHTLRTPNVFERFMMTSRDGIVFEDIFAKEKERNP